MKFLIMDNKESPIYYRLVILMICIVNIGYNTMFSITHVLGNKFYVSQLMSLLQSSGNIVSPILLRFFNDINSYKLCVGMIFIIVNISKHLIITPYGKQFLFFAQCIISGSIDNCTYIIYGNWMNPVYLATGLELAYCVASILAATSTVITHSE